MRPLAEIISWILAVQPGVLDYSYCANPPPVRKSFVETWVIAIIQTGTNLLTFLVLPVNPEREDIVFIAGDCYLLAVGTRMYKRREQEGAADKEKTEKPCEQTRTKAECAKPI